MQFFQHVQEVDPSLQLSLEPSATPPHVFSTLPGYDSAKLTTDGLQQASQPEQPGAQRTLHGREPSGMATRCLVFTDCVSDCFSFMWTSFLSLLCFCCFLTGNKAHHEINPFMNSTLGFLSC